MRVIAGCARGRRLDAPPGRGVRPTADRVREALFSSLSAAVPGARVLDLYAGSGALAIEALSRGAAWATLVERDRPAAGVAAANLVRAGVADRGAVLRMDAEVYLRAPRGGPFGIVFLDPPYDHPLPELYATVVALQRAGALTAEAWVVIERDRRDPDLRAEPPATLRVDRHRAYGDTVLVYLLATEPPGADSARVRA